MFGIVVAYAAALSHAAGDPPGPAAREPGRPEVFSQSVEIRCGSQTLVVRGFGARFGQSGPAPILLLNGRPLRGGDAERMRGDLMRPGAAYRMMAQCHPSGAILFAFNLGERVFPEDRPPGEMRYHRASAEIAGGRIVRYSGMQPIGEEQYWFR